MTYAKLIDGEIVPAPKTITKHFNPYPVDMMIEDGYKELVRTEPPEVPEGYHAEGHWVEKETTIEFVWEIVPGPAPDDLIDE